MAQPKYILWLHRGKAGERVEQAEVIPACFQPVYERCADMAGFRCSKQVGNTRKGFTFSSRDACANTAATAHGVKQVIRELRPQETVKLDAIDAEIEALRAQLNSKRKERTAALKAAFTKGHVVRLQDVVAECEARLKAK